MKITKPFIIAFFCCLISISAMAGKAKEEPASSVAGISVVLIIIIALGFGIRIISKNLRRVGKDLEDSFGEKVLP